MDWDELVGPQTFSLSCAVGIDDFMELGTRKLVCGGRED